MGTSTTPSITIDVLPAARGDCLWVECTREHGPPWRLLIDGGMSSAYSALEARIQACAASGSLNIDLAVVSHIDSDHIGGMLQLLQAEELDITFGDIWFNGFDQLPESYESLPRSVAQGEQLVKLLSSRAMQPEQAKSKQLPWNERFRRAAVMTSGDQAYETIVFPEGPTLTLLSPTPRRLVSLRKKWEQHFAELKRGEPEPDEPSIELPLDDLATLADSPTSADQSAANGSSIAFLLEYAGRRCLFAADAFSKVLGPALTTLANERGERIELDVFKLPHHASKGNVTKALIELSPADHYIVSTNGERFNHPDDIALARVVMNSKRPCTLWFNYASRAAARWSDPALREKYGFQTRQPAPDAPHGVRLELPGRPQ